MTQPQTVPRRRRLPLCQRPAALVAVFAGRALAHLPPKRIRAVLTVLRRRAAPATYQQAQHAQDAILATSVLCAGRYCLQRSLATTLLCRIRGVWPTWCTGVRTAPFAAHAWVEVDGQPVGESQDLDSYRALIAIAPERPSVREGAAVAPTRRNNMLDTDTPDGDEKSCPQPRLGIWPAKIKRSR